MLFYLLLQFLTSLFLGFIIFACLYLIIINQFWKKRNVPFVEPQLFYGNVKWVGERFHACELMQELYSKLKPLGCSFGGFYLYTRPSAMALSFDFIKSVMIKDFKVFSNKGGYYNKDDDPLSESLINLENNQWQALRQKLTPIFTTGKIKMMFETISDRAEILVNTIEKETATEGPLEVKDILSRYTTDVIGATAFGVECNALENKNSKFYYIALKSFKSFNFLKRNFLQAYRKLALKLHVVTTNKEVSDFYFHIIDETLHCRKQNPQIQRNDFLNLLINLKNSGVITFNQLVAQSVSSRNFKLQLNLYFFLIFCSPFFS